MAFVQIIECTTSRPEELQRLADEWAQATEGRSRARRGVLTADRDHPGRYVDIVFFDSFEEAMANSQLPETQDFAARMRELLDGEPTFHNLDVIDERDFG
jgi:hypothetical protein